MATLNAATDDEEVSDELAQVAELVLQDLEEPELPLAAAPTAAGLEVVRALQAAVFGASSVGQSLPRCVYLASLPRALCAQRLCVAALLDLVGTANCLSLATLGASTGVEALRARAAACALAHFSEAAALDYSGLVGLEEEALMALLCSDELAVDSELDAFRALVAWVEHDRGTRLPGFATRLARAVRLAQLEPSDLVFLDVHPLVASDRTALSLVAHAYICKVVGTQYDQPFGLESTARPRRCQRASAAAGAGHSGVTPATPAAPRAADGGCSRHTHGSLLEATMCTLAARARGAAAAASPASPEEVEALALEAAVRRLSMEGHGHVAAATAEAPGSPALPGLGAIPTPTNAALAAAPKLQPVHRVHHYGSARAKRSASRRSLFTMAEEAGSDVEGEVQEASSSAASATEPALAEAADAQGGKDSPARGAPGASAARLASAPSATGAALRMRSGVALEMALSPSQPSLREMAAAREAVAAAPLLDHTWQGRKRLRFL